MKRVMASERYDNLTSRTSELAVRAQNLKQQIEATEQASLRLRLFVYELTLSMIATVHFMPRHLSGLLA